MPCPACAPRPDAAVDQHIRVRFRDTGRAEPRVEVDQHKPGECDCCDEWRRAMDAERARAEAAERGVLDIATQRDNVLWDRDVLLGKLRAAEERAADWHRLADERSAALVAAEASAARMEAALREVREAAEEHLRGASLATYRRLRAALSPAPPEGPCVHGIPVARCAWCAVQGPEGDGDLRGLLREAVEHLPEHEDDCAHDADRHEMCSCELGAFLRRARAAIGKEADGE